MKYLVLAYMAIWLGFFLYLLRLQSILRNLEKNLHEIQGTKGHNQDTE